jgi:tripartite-type tricarboxylate transporter receptor subunit TctC
MKRIGNAMLPDVPTMSAASLAGYDAALWTAFVLPAGASAAIIEQLNREVVAIVRSPGNARGARQAGGRDRSRLARGARARIRDDIKKWREVIVSAGIGAQ